jgi:hypothetical protein
MSGRKYIGPYSSQPDGSEADISRHGLTGAIGATGVTGASLPTGLYRASLWIETDVSGTAGTLQLSVTAPTSGNAGATT